MSVLENLTVTRAAAYRTPAWMGLGNVFDTPTTDIDKAMALAGLDSFIVTEESLTPEFGDARFVVPVKGIVVTVDGERKVVGVAGKDRPAITPSEGFAFLQDLAGHAAEIEIIGTLRDDRTVFGCLRWDRPAKPGNGDADIARYITVAFAYDGTMPLTAFVGDIRPECMNTINAAIKSAAQSFRIRQTKNARERMAVQAETFKKANAYADAMDKAIEEMLATAYSDKQFDALVSHYVRKPEKDVKGTMAKYDDKREAHLVAWNAAHNANVRGTAFGAFNVMAEVAQWGRQMREGDKGREAFFMAGAGFDGPTEKYRADVFATVRKRAGLAVV